MRPEAVTTIAVIPARGGSKGLPGKNLRTVGGVPLIRRAVGSCLASQHIDATYVSTDDRDIARVAADGGAQVIIRPDELSGDTATSESAVLHVLEVLAERGTHPQVVLLVQCTSPFIEPTELDAAAEMILVGAAETAFAAVPTYEFLWRDAGCSVPPGAGSMEGVNHDARIRPRRQDRRPHFRETGAFYAMSAAGLREAEHRFFGRTRVVPVPQHAALEIDTMTELRMADVIEASRTSPAGIGQEPVDVDAVITDFDGVHTDDAAMVDQHGVESVRVSRSDGLGVSRLRKLGIPFLIISTEVNPVVTTRAAKLGVDVLQGVDDKRAAVRAWLESNQIDADRVAYLGNDINDQAAMGDVGWPVAVGDARPEIRERARRVLTRTGGHGAVRELCDLIVCARAGSAATAV